MNHENPIVKNVPWNKGKLIGQISPLKLKEIWAILIRLQMVQNNRGLALFNLAIVASFGDAIWSSLKAAMLRKMAECHLVQLSCSRKLRGRFNLK